MRTRSTPSTEELKPFKIDQKNKEQATKTHKENSRDSSSCNSSDNMSPNYTKLKTNESNIMEDSENKLTGQEKDALGEEISQLATGNGGKDDDASRIDDSPVFREACSEMQAENEEENRKRGNGAEKSSADMPIERPVLAETSTASDENDEGETSDNADRGEDVSTSTSRVKNSNLQAMLPSFTGNAAALFPGQFHSELAKTFYNSLSMLATQNLLNVKQEEPNPSIYSTSSNEGKLQVPRRNDSRSSDGSARSYDDEYRNRRDGLDHRDSPSPSRGSRKLHGLIPGMSPQSIAEQLRNNDSASMVVSRRQKFTGRNQGLSRSAYAHSDNETPPPSFPTLNPSESSPRHSDLVTSSNNMSSSPSLHHFTTRYTVEPPSDPSRLGVELVLDHDEDEPVIEVECGGNRGLLYVNRLCQGSKGQSIHFNDEWLTPNEFQFISGRETAKDWKRSIRHCGKSLKTLMTKGILQVHPPVCECNQCRGLHSGSKLLGVKRTPQKDNTSDIISKRIKSVIPFNFAPDGNYSQGDDMTRHGFDSGGLNSIISQLRKANGFEANESSGTLDLSSKSQQDRTDSSLDVKSRKRSRENSPGERQPKVEPDEGGRSSPAAKRPYPEQDEYNHNTAAPASYSASYAFLSPEEEQYRRMLALMSRSLSPREQQRQILNLAQNLGHPLGMNPFTGEFPTLSHSVHPNSDRSKRQKMREGTDDAFDFSRRVNRRPNEPSSTRPGYGFTPVDKHRKPDHRRTPTPSRGDKRYIALESRHRDDRPPSRSPRDDIRSWTASRHAAMIDLNSSGSSQGRMSDWNPKLPWSMDRNHSGGRHQDIKPNSSRNGSHTGLFQDNIVLDRIPISETPVTTLHHRPPSNLSPESESRRRTSGSGNRFSSQRHENDSKDTPMLDLQKHAIPMLSLKRPTQENLLNSDRRLGKRLSNNSDQEMNDISASDRQSSSAPPPHLSPREGNRYDRRPTSAQERLRPPLPHAFRIGSPVGRPETSVADNINTTSPHDRKSVEIREALDKMRKWSVEDVCKFIKDVYPDIGDKIEEFRKREIDGEGLPLLTDRHLLEIMDINLGCALKIISRVKRVLKILPDSLTCCHYSFVLPPNTNSSTWNHENMKTDEKPALKSDTETASDAVDTEVDKES